MARRFVLFGSTVVHISLLLSPSRGMDVTRAHTIFMSSGGPSGITQSRASSFSGILNTCPSTNWTNPTWMPASVVRLSCVTCGSPESVGIGYRIFLDINGEQSYLLVVLYLRPSLDVGFMTRAPVVTGLPAHIQPCTRALSCLDLILAVEVCPHSATNQSLHAQ